MHYWPDLASLCAACTCSVTSQRWLAWRCAQVISILYSIYRLTTAMGLCPIRWKCRRQTKLIRFPTWSESAVGSNPTYTVLPGTLNSSLTVELQHASHFFRTCTSAPPLPLPLVQYFSHIHTVYPNMNNVSNADYCCTTHYTQVDQWRLLESSGDHIIDCCM